jgi:hypothetical protein
MKTSVTIKKKVEQLVDFEVKLKDHYILEDNDIVKNGDMCYSFTSESWYSASEDDIGKPISCFSGRVNYFIFARKFKTKTIVDLLVENILGKQVFYDGEIYKVSQIQLETPRNIGNIFVNICNDKNNSKLVDVMSLHILETNP